MAQQFATKGGNKQLCVIQITQDKHQMEVHQGESKTPHASQTQNKGKGKRKKEGRGVHMNKGRKANQGSTRV